MMNGSASCMITPSPTRPARRSAFGPYAATQIGRRSPERPLELHGVPS